MPKVRKKRHPCGHYNFGATCRRCGVAALLEMYAQAGGKKRNPDRKGSRDWTPEELLVEAARLREVPV